MIQKAQKCHHDFNRILVNKFKASSCTTDILCSLAENNNHIYLDYFSFLEVAGGMANKND